MIAKPIIPNLYSVTYTIPTGSVNAYILKAADGLTLIDTGYTDGGQRMLTALRELGHAPTDVRHILVTHAHSDHAGSLAALKQATGARAYMHPTDSPMVRQGDALRPDTHGTPGWPNQLAFALGVRLLARTIPPAAVDQPLNDGDTLPIAGGLQVIHVPGHSAGQVALLWQSHGILFTADAVVNLLGKLRYGPVVEDFPQLQASIHKLHRFNFDVACFGHGAPLTTRADHALRNSGL